MLCVFYYTDDTAAIMKTDPKFTIFYVSNPQNNYSSRIIIKYSHFDNLTQF